MHPLFPDEAAEITDKFACQQAPPGGHRRRPDRELYGIDAREAVRIEGGLIDQVQKIRVVEIEISVRGDIELDIVVNAAGLPATSHKHLVAGLDFMSQLHETVVD